MPTPLSKAQRQEIVRENARKQREHDKQRSRRTRIMIQSGVVVAVVAVAIVAVILVSNAVRPSGTATGPANMISDSVVIGASEVTQRTVANSAGQSPSAQAPTDGVKRLTVYLDYQCPWCKTFEATNGAQIENWLKSGKISLEIHPLAILDKSSPNRYATRAANAAACVANFAPDHYFEFNTAMFARQPDEGTAGPTNSELASFVQLVTGENADIASCITGETYTDWVGQATKRGWGNPNTFSQVVTQTPTIYLNNTQVDGNAATDASILKTLVEG